MGSLEREKEDRRDRQAAGLRRKGLYEARNLRSRNINAWRKAKAIHKYRSVYLT